MEDGNDDVLLSGTLGDDGFIYPRQGWATEQVAKSNPCKHNSNDSEHNLNLLADKGTAFSFIYVSLSFIKNKDYVIALFE